MSISYVYTEAATTMAKEKKFKDLNSTQRLTLIMLSTYADSKNGTCYPSQSELAEVVGVTRRTMVSTLQKLEKLGYITSKRRTVKTESGKASQTSNLYKLNIKVKKKATKPRPAKTARPKRNEQSDRSWDEEPYSNVVEINRRREKDALTREEIETEIEGEVIEAGGFEETSFIDPIELLNSL